MYESYADVLESYMIEPAEEGFKDIVKKAGSAIVNTIKKLIERIKNLIIRIKNKFSNKQETAAVVLQNSEEDDTAARRQAEASRREAESARYSQKLAGEFSRAIKCITKYNTILYNAVVKYNQTDEVPEDTVTTLGAITSELGGIYNDIDDIINKGARLDRKTADSLTNALQANISQLQRLVSVVHNSSNSDISKIIGMGITENGKLCGKIEHSI